MRERKDLSNYNIHLAADIVVRATRRARNFNGTRIKPIANTELFGFSGKNFDEAESQQRAEQQKIINLVPNQPLYLTQAQDIVNNGFEIDQGNSLE